MNCDQYLRSEGAITATSLAEAIGVSKGRLSQLRYSLEWPGELALKAEAETAGVIDAGAISTVIRDARTSAPANASAAA